MRTTPRQRPMRTFAAAAGLAGALLLTGCGSGKPRDQRHHEQGLIALERTRDYGKAAAEFEEALKINPGRPETLLLLSRAYILLARFDDALKTLNRLQETGDADRADLGRTEVYLARAGRSVAQAENLGQFTAIRDDLAAAGDHAAAYLQRKPDDPEGYLHQAQVMMEQRRFHTSRRDFLRREAQKDRDQRRPEDAKQKEKNADDDDEAARKLLEEATDVYEKVTTLDVRNVSAFRLLRDNLEALGQVDRAETAADRLLAVLPKSDVALLTKAEIASRRYLRTQSKDDLEETRQYAQRVLDETPKHEEANLVMARWALAAQQPDVAIERAQLVPAASQRSSDALYLRGLAYFMKQNYEMAIDSLQRVVARRPRAQTYLLLADSYQKTNNPQQAQSALYEALRLDPKNEQALLNLGDAYLNEGQLDAARDLLKRADLDQPAIGQFLRGRIHEAEARQAWTEGRDQAYLDSRRKASECYDKAAELRPESSFAQDRLIARLLLTGRHSEAIAEADKALAANPGAYEIRHRKAQAQAALGQFGEAIATCRDNVARFPARDESRLLINDIYVRYGRLDLAIRDAEAAAKTGFGHLIDRRLAVLYLNRARDENDTAADLTSAHGAAQRVLDKLPDDLPMLLAAAEATRRLGDPQAAKKFYDHALVRHPDNPLVLDQAATAAMLRRDHDAARQSYERALEVAPQRVAAIYSLGMVLVADGKADQAVARFREAIRVRSLQATHYPALVVALQAAGNTGEALNVATSALEAIGSNHPLESARVMLLMGMGRPAEALTSLDAMESRHAAAGRPLDPNAVRHVRALVEMLKNDPERASRVALQANLADFYFGGRWHRQAAAAAEGALALVPKSVNRMVALFSCLAADGARNRDRLLALGQQIVGADDAWPNAHMLVAAQYERAGRFDDAERHLRRAIELQPGTLDSRVRMGIFYERRGDRAKALEEYRAAAALPEADLGSAPLSAYHVYNNLAYLLATHAGDVPAASAIAEKASAVAERNPDLMRNAQLYGTVLDTIGWIEHLAGKHADAIATLERANILVPFNSSLLYHLGMAYLAAGDKTNARRCLSEAVDVAPGEISERSEDARNLEEAKRALKSLEAA